MKYEIINTTNNMVTIYGYDYGHTCLIIDATHSTWKGSWDAKVKLNTAGFHAKNLAQMIEDRILEINVPDYRHTLATAIKAI